MNQKILSIEERLDYCFSNKDLLKTALTHRSYGIQNNERLEFLGDGVLDFAIAASLYEKFPSVAEGELTRFRASLVRQESLFELAQELQLGSILNLGEGEIKSGGAARPSILADALEAIFAAVYLDGGFEASQSVIDRLYVDKIAALKIGVLQKDAKTRLQEHLQGNKKPLPRYVLQSPETLNPLVFHVRCEIDDPYLQTVGEGSSRRGAEQQAAAAALCHLLPTGAL